MNPALVFPAAHHRGGVERITWEALRRFAAEGPVSFVGAELDRTGLPAAIGHVPVRVPAWARGGLGPWGFRRAAAAALGARPALGPVVSFGVEAPPGDVVVVNSIHRVWLERGRPATIRGRQVPNAARHALPRHRVLLSLERRYFTDPRPRTVVVVSAAVGDDLVRCYGVDAARLVVIPNGYDPERCNPGRRATERHARRAALGIAPEQVVLLFVANELHRKGLGVLLEAVARLGVPEVEVHVVGRTPLTDYAGRIDALGLTGRVRSHGSTDDIGAFHAAADALVLPTQYEAFALTVVEALASGLPVITTTVPGAGDLITHDTNGLLQHDPLDATELAGLLGRLLDPAVRARLGAAAPASVAGYDWWTLMGRLYATVEAVA